MWNLVRVCNKNIRYQIWDSLFSYLLFFVSSILVMENYRRKKKNECHAIFMHNKYTHIILCQSNKVHQGFLFFCNQDRLVYVSYTNQRTLVHQWWFMVTVLCDFLFWYYSNCPSNLILFPAFVWPPFVVVISKDFRSLID